MIKQKTIILIDGHALAYRMFFALERTRMRTSENQPTWAIYGFFKALFDLLHKVKPDAMAVSFDCGRETFRLKEYSEYKANRTTMPDTLREQMALLEEGIKTFDIPIYKMPGFEADDVIGTIANKASQLGHKTFILTGDQDSFQLVDKEGFVKVLIPSKGDLIEYDTDKVYGKFGVWPEQIIDFKGLSGDSSDNIPGVKGVGEKTAVKLLEEYKTIENIYENLDKITSESLKSKLEADKDMAFMSKFLATINREVPIEFDFEHTHLDMPDFDKPAAFMKKMEFYSFLKQLPEILKSFNGEIKMPSQKPVEIVEKAVEKVSEPKENVQSQLTLDFGFGSQPQKVEIEPVRIQPVQYFETVDTNFEKKIIDNKEDLKDLVKTLESLKVFSIDTETTGIDVFEAKLVGISLGWDEKLAIKDNKLDITEVSQTKTAYIPVGHIFGTQLDTNYVLAELKPVLENPDVKKVFQNAKYELNMLKNYGVSIKGILFDTMIASYVKDPSHKHGLKHQALYYLKFEMQDIAELIGKGKTSITMDKISIEDVANYSCADAYATLELAKFHQRIMDESQEKVFYDIEMPLIEVLSEMEMNGISIDTDYLKDLSNEIARTIEILEAKIFEIAGLRFNLNSPKQVGDILFEKLQIPSKGLKKTQTGYSTSAKILESLVKTHPIASLLLEHRHLSKIKSTYIDSLPELICVKDGRIHTSFNQTVTTTGRLSSSNPNLQNIPIRTEIGNRIRAAFVPKDKQNSIILSADYSQIELRLLAHMSKDPNLSEAFLNNIDVHTATASKVFATPVEEVTKDMRRKAKTVNFGIIYGQTSYGLSESLGISPGEAKVFIEKYFETYPKIRDFIDKTTAFAHEHGYVETIFGRKRYLGEDLYSRNRMLREFAERAAVNAPLQGTAADLIKIAMIRLQEKLSSGGYKSQLIMQVHDELVLEVKKDEMKDIANLVKSCMELDQPLDVPLVVDMQYGQSWMETKAEVMALTE